MAQTVVWQRVEGLIILVMGLSIFWHWHFIMSWWVALLAFLAPDVSFLSYLFGPRLGALCYNTVHTYALGAAVLSMGLIYSQPTLVVLGALWLAHSGFDRMLGYGLKSPEGFSFTHLGRIGK